MNRIQQAIEAVNQAPTPIQKWNALDIWESLNGKLDERKERPQVLLNTILKNETNQLQN